MLQNYLKIALRNLRKQPVYSIINIGGLALGLACCFLILLFVQNELSYDRFHEKGDRIHRLLMSFSSGERQAITASGFAVDLAAQFPEIEQAVRVENTRRPHVLISGERRDLGDFALADPAFFEVFDFFGLAAYSAQQRTKEIGVRKVLGASVRDIVVLLSREFTLLVIIAFAIAAPIAYYVMTQWLGNFAYRISPGVGTFALAAGVTVIIAWLTVSYQSFRAAIADPVKSLRYE